MRRCVSINGDCLHRYVRKYICSQKTNVSTPIHLVLHCGAATRASVRSLAYASANLGNPDPFLTLRHTEKSVIGVPWSEQLLLLAIC